MHAWKGRTAPGIEVIETMAEAARAALPPAFAGLAAQVVLRVEDLACEEMLDELEIDDPFELTGLYEGPPLTEKSVMDQPAGPDVIWLFRRAILDEWVSRGDVALEELVAHVMVHELAHHFGWSDDDIAAIDRWWE
ncbi:neutral zinc metallopeptidase [Rhodobacter veldkampii DSM 11550]|uniref:Neutral zinc metallopeptidase n=1 Tax=Phaeovulum veldkampii DSM 11550 TaxID=1185920 RepID=A0A2T4JI48_9RHOB|nr:metallopeptidase family protein [Phaeovulum veldkampii]MBK5947333.1 neutral zinc metallopeptidase [Phaeovulum veldkampii DSM 11550]PTE17590.1 neutral zinc metallopeptidase [Phaeovulum veldkampii DSM 11550]TDQ60243.1 putative Zn-dependent protease with MMP-like domain [Phaeovulum veldkampii DSM 11550]